MTKSSMKPTASIQQQSHFCYSSAWLIAGLLSVFIALYLLTAQQGVSWQDSGVFQYRVLAHDYFGSFGLALAHPAYIAGAELFTGLFPSSCRFYALNLFSGLGMTLALTLLARLFVLLKLKPATILVTLLTLGLSHMVWWMSTIAEVYTWSLAFLAAELLCVIKLCKKETGHPFWLWILLAMLNGLHASFHNFAFLNLPIYALLFVYLRWNQKRVHTFMLLVLTPFAWLTGASLLVALFQMEWSETGSFMATLKSLFFGRGFEDVVTGRRALNWPLAKMNFALASISFINPVWFFACCAGRTRQTFAPFKVALLGLTGVHALFWVRYFVPDQATFVLPTLALSSIWVAIGLDSVSLSRRQLLGLCATVLLFSLATPVVTHHVLRVTQHDVHRSRQLPFREESRYWLYPWKQDECSAAQFVDKVRKTLREGDLLIADSTAAGPLIASQASGQLSKKIRILSFITGETHAELIRLLEKQERAYIVSPVPGYAPATLLTSQFTFEKEDVLYRVRKVHHD
jgi:hypothetical protein